LGYIEREAVWEDPRGLSIFGEDTLFPLLGVLQNDAAPLIVDDSPFFDLVQGAKASEACEAVVEAAIADARGLNRPFDIAHWRIT
jgi:hypothetical protein